MNKSLWNLLLKESLVTGKQPNDLEIDSPWYVKMLLAFSGWLAALFFLGFWGAIFTRLYRNTPVLIALGLTLIIGAYFLLVRKKSNEFLEHLGLAFSLAGQALLVVATLNNFGIKDSTTLFIILGLLQLLLAALMPNFVHRVFSSFFAVISFATAIYYGQNSNSGLHLYTAFVMLITTLLWLNEFHFLKWLNLIQANAYGFVLALVTIKGTSLFMHTNLWGKQTYSEDEWIQPWMGELLLSAVTLFLVLKLIQKNNIKLFSTAGVLAIAGTLALTFLSLQAQGLIVGVMIILLGFSASNRVLMGLGIVALLFFISSYYYLLENTLLEKSITLLLLGVGLLIGHFLIQRLGVKSKGGGTL